MKLKLQHEQQQLLSRLAELGAGNALQTCTTTQSKGTQATPPVIAEGPKYEPPPMDSSKVEKPSDDENMVIDVISQESEDETSSTTSGSDGGTTCTTTSRKYEIAV